MNSNTKFYVPKETVKMLKKAGYPDDTPTYHEVVDWFEKHGIYIAVNMMFDDNTVKKVYYSAECFIGDDDYALDEYSSREKALNSAFVAVLENYEFDLENQN